MHVFMFVVLVECGLRDGVQSPSLGPVFLLKSGLASLPRLWSVSDFSLWRRCHGASEWEDGLGAASQRTTGAAKWEWDRRGAQEPAHCLCPHFCPGSGIELVSYLFPVSSQE